MSTSIDLDLSQKITTITDISISDTLKLHFNSTLIPGTADGFFALHNASLANMYKFTFCDKITPPSTRHRLQILTNEYEDSKIYFEANEKKLFKYLLINNNGPILLLWDISKHKSKGLTLSNSLSESISNLNIYGDDIYTLDNSQELTDSITANSNSFTLYAYNSDTYIESTFVLPLAGCTIQRVATNDSNGFDIKFVLPDANNFTDNSSPLLVLLNSSTPYKLFTVHTDRMSKGSSGSGTLKYGLYDEGTNNLSFIGNNATVATVSGSVVNYHVEYKDVNNDVYDYFEDERFDEINFVLYKNTLCLDTSSSSSNTKPNYYKNGSGNLTCLIKVHNNIATDNIDFYDTPPNATTTHVNYLRDYENSLKVTNDSNTYYGDVVDRANKDQYIYNVKNTTQNYITSRLYVFKATSPVSVLDTAEDNKTVLTINASNNITVSPNSYGILIDKYDGNDVINKYFINTIDAATNVTLFIDSGKYDLYYFTTSDSVLTLNKGTTTQPSITYDFYVDVFPSKSDNDTSLVTISSTSEDLNKNMIEMHFNPYLLNLDGLFDPQITNVSTNWGGYNPSNGLGYDLGTKLFSITPSGKVDNFSLVAPAGIYMAGFRIQLGSQVLYQYPIANGPPSISGYPYTTTITLEEH